MTTDWITALSGVFAAVGTVGAVGVALWQVARQRERSMNVQCRSAIVAEAMGTRGIVSLRGTNDGYRPVKIAMAYLMTNDGRQAVAHFTPYSTKLPVVLQDGESVEISWYRDDLESLRSKEECEFLYALFMDVLGTVYVDAFPGVRVTRKGLRRRVTYDLPAVAKNAPSSTSSA